MIRQELTDDVKSLKLNLHTAFVLLIEKDFKNLPGRMN